MYLARAKLTCSDGASDASHARHVDEQARLPSGSRAAEVG
jgi:hypothetical protein